ncbi:ABC transporter permease [Spirochaetia bacterium 38H-sp]|uniref:ABC transporter permease n=1 Tax=Rarispira pelagica TaxID=3141764 RepID=A0ABU9UDZ9_9SPIR
MLAILKKELRTFFTSPIGYIYMGGFLLFSGYFFATQSILTRNPQYTNIFSGMITIFLFIMPMLTMRLMSEEKNQKTDQLLITSPTSVGNIIIGKFLAAYVIFAITLAITILYAIVIEIHGKLPLWETIGSYIGFLLLGGAYISVGLFISTMTENQIVSALVSFFAVLLLLFLDNIANAMPAENIAGLIFAIILAALLSLYLYRTTKNIFLAAVVLAVAIVGTGIAYIIDSSLFYRLITKTLQILSLNNRYKSFGMGIFEVSGIVYYISYMAFFLFLSTHAVERRRWV